MGSYLRAKKAQGKWLLRIEDIDPPREKPGTADNIIRTLEEFGFEWHGPVIYQSENTQHYQNALEALLRRDLLYACDCTRKQIISNARQTDSGYVYAGTCRKKKPADLKPEHAWRIKANHQPNEFTINDLIQGWYTQNVARDVGDFILKRRDGLWSYQLAVVVDDAMENISEVVRGTDLLDNTARQIYLQKLLNLPTPNYVHLPLALNEAGDKLSKQTFAESLDPNNKLKALYAAWHFLQQAPVSKAEQTDDLREFWDQALLQWDISHVSI